MARAFVCPICEDRNVVFSGLKGNLIMRATCEWVAVFVCENSHVFSVFMTDVASALGLPSSKTARSGELEKNLRRFQSKIVRLAETELASVHNEPPQWRELQELAREEKDPQRLQVLVEQMNDVLCQYEQPRSNPILPLSTRANREL
jgi:hypothetical protein